MKNADASASQKASFDRGTALLFAIIFGVAYPLCCHLPPVTRRMWDWLDKMETAFAAELAKTIRVRGRCNIRCSHGALSITVQGRWATAHAAHAVIDERDQPALSWTAGRVNTIDHSLSK